MRKRINVMTNKNINIPVIARVEGEGALDLQIRDGKIAKLHLRIYEPPRLFEKFLEGREPNEVVDAVARICGICPVAYQMSAVHAIEQAFEMEPGPWVRQMRRLFYCGEWMESHGIHIHMLAAPDFLGYNSVLEMAKDHPAVVERGMQLHGLGMELMSLLGMRSVHPVGACVGGFYYAPKADDVRQLLSRFEQALPLGLDLVKWALSLPLPDAHEDFVSVALQHPHEYPMNEGQIVSSNGLNILAPAFEDHFEEFQLPHSTALHSTFAGRPYLVGPLARMNLNLDCLPAEIQPLLADAGIQFPSQNMFHSIIARCIEVYYCMLEAIQIMKAYALPSQSRVPLTPKAGVGFGCTEAPRGLLWHRYEFDEKGLVTDSKIVPPTSQNQARIEQDLIHGLQTYGLDHSDAELRAQSEMIIRNYDPCISCATHFLTLKVDR
jgi:coenzyme F420-reducing hydrogenase alpha subunit